MSKTFPKTWQPENYQKNLYQMWEKAGYFKPEINPKGDPFCIIMPPPNANGSLHLGHAVFVSLEDIMTRFARLRGKAALWLPGADHAGFETQVVYEKKLEKEGKSRFKMERPELYREMWQFTQENKKKMEDQLRELGASCDWNREKFTLDEDIVATVYQTFKKLYDDGLVYRDLRPVNWCTKHQTSLSDLEVKYEEQTDPLYYIKYGPLTLATVRPETKFGDTAVAVNPHDKRYQKYIGQEIDIETVLGPAKIKVIADDMVDPKFGTGVVKITPAHDPNDFEAGRRHNLEIREVVDQYGKMNEKAGSFAGLKVSEARVKVVEAMKEKGLIEKIDENYTHSVGKCYKCGTPIEPRILPQWFIAMNKESKSGKNLSKDALAAVKDGQVKFVSKQFEKIFNHWLKNIRDWNVSRQIVWGIQLPIWYCENSENASGVGSSSHEVDGLPTMGFAAEVVPQLFDGKTQTWRLHDHALKSKDKVLFTNSQTGANLGVATITKVEKKKITEINLKDPAHHQAYEKVEDLIKAFEKHHPNQKITLDNDVWVYSYDFQPFCQPIITDGQVPDKCPDCGGKNLERDPDVFDTWFSSGQWPFATLKATGDFDKFYPTSVMETGWDILFFWVARMIMLGLYETGQVPFKDVYLHGLVRDKDRQKMSKSKGNVIDPLGVAELYGADAVRMALVFGVSAGNDVVISEEKIRGMRNFTNKIWNAARFVALSVSDGDLKTGELGGNKLANLDIDRSILANDDKKILAEHQEVTKKVTDNLENFRFQIAAETVYDYFWHSFCDFYIEVAKKKLGEKHLGGGLLDSSEVDMIQNTKKILIKILSETLVLLHPFIPFVTEAIWQEIREVYPNLKESIMIADWQAKTKASAFAGGPK